MTDNNLILIIDNTLEELYNDRISTKEKLKQLTEEHNIDIKL